MTNQEFIESIRLEGEEWRAIPGWEDVYYASSFGRIASMPRIALRSGQKMQLSGKLMKQLTDKLGYKYIFLRRNGDYQRIFVHKCVALTFIPNPYHKPEIDHIDTNPGNNCVWNLRWVSSSENHLNPLTLRRLIDKTFLKEEIAIVAEKDGITKIFRSYCEAQRLGFNRNGIRRCIYGGQNSYRGYKWHILSDYENLVSMSKNSLSKTDTD